MRKERDILSQCAHTVSCDHVVRMYGSYQDSAETVLVLELLQVCTCAVALLQVARLAVGLTRCAQGGDLFSMLGRHGRLHNGHARYYAGCVQRGLRTLHGQGVVYRDLKPEVRGVLSFAAPGFTPMPPCWVYWASLVVSVCCRIAGLQALRLCFVRTDSSLHRT